MIDFFFMLSTYINLYYTSGSISILGEQLLEPPKSNDEHDFMNSNGRRKPKAYDVYLQMTFCWFPYFLIGYLIIFAATFHGSGMTDMISTVYLFLAFYYIVNFRKFFTKNSNMLTTLRIYNYVVLFSQLAFQAPLFLCPAIPSSNVGYISYKNCSTIQNTQKEIT
jgi:hypothetical protein